MKKPQKEQFNTRLSGDLKRAMRIMSAVMDTSTEELTEVLLAASLGSRDPKIRAKQEPENEQGRYATRKIAFDIVILWFLVVGCTAVVLQKR